MIGEPHRDPIAERIGHAEYEAVREHRERFVNAHGHVPVELDPREPESS